MDRLNGESAGQDEERAQWLKGQEAVKRRVETLTRLTRTAEGRTIAVRDKEAKKENASRGGLILTEMTTKGGAPTWSLYSTTPILPSTTPKPRRF